MSVTIKNYNTIYKHGRNVVCATLYEGDNILRTDELSSLLRFIDAQGLELANAHQVLRELVLKQGFTV